MRRAINLRQVEIFKAVVEHGTVSRAAMALRISQPAASKHLVHLEDDTGLKLFNRHKGRLTPTALGLRFYEEIEKIFSSVRQVESAVDIVKREDLGQLFVGVIPALGDAFIQRTTMRFLKDNKDVFFSITPLASQWIAEFVRNRKVDVGIVSSRTDDPNIKTDLLIESPLVCIMPIGHPLTRHKVIEPGHLDAMPFVSFNPDSYIGVKTREVFERYGVRPDIVLTAQANPALRHFVAAGLGVSLVHPLFITGIEDQVVARPFEPRTEISFHICHARNARNEDLIFRFAAEAQNMAGQIMDEMAGKWS